MSSWIIFIFGLSLLFNGYAQNIGQNPARLNWQLLETPAGNVIFSNGMDAQAQRVANLINYQSDSLSSSVGQKSKRINLIIQNQTVIPNGYVALSPFRSELYVTPPENLQIQGSINWLDGLAIHEYRHVQQFANMRYGLTKFAYFLQGQNGWNVMANLSIPDWYFEGDAVIMETALTNSGRGRTPTFTALQRTLVGSNINYRYQKVRNGSYKDLVPNHYATGYMMLSHIRNTKGNNVMVPVIKDASAYKGVVYPFSRALKKHTGCTSTTLYKASLANASKIWSAQTDSLRLTVATRVTDQQRKTVTSYHFPQFTLSGEIVVMKNSFKKTNQIVLISKKGEKVLAYPGINLSSYFQTANDKFVWTEISQNPRRSNVSYSDIYYKEIGSRKRKVTKKGKYFSPVLSSDSSIIAIHISSDQQCSLRQIDVITKKEKTILTFRKDEFVVRPAYSEGDKSIVYVLMKNNQLSLWKYDLISHQKTQLTRWTSHIIDAPKVNGNYVYYTASFSGIDNIYRSPLDGSFVVEQLTSVKIGAYDPCVSADGKTLLFTEPTEMGRVISKVDLEEVLREKNTHLHYIEPINMKWQDEVAYHAEGGNVLDKIPQNSYASKSYNGLLRGFTLHSWSISPSLAVPELVLSFNNYLDDVSASLGAGYNLNEKSNFYRGEVIFGRWYPLFKFGATQSDRSAYYLINDNFIELQSFNETSASVSASVPLERKKGNYSSGFSPGVVLKQYWIADRSNSVGNLPNDNYATIAGKVDFHLLRRTAYQNLAPRFGFSGFLEYLKNLNVANNEKIVGLAKIYLPGIWANHSLRFSAGYRKELLSNDFQQFDDFEYMRGFDAPINESFTKFSIEYSLPLLYPDLGFFGITYFKRIRTNLFFDHGEARLLDFKATFQSVGIELIFDNILFNVVPMTIGIRGSYLLSEIPVDESRIKPSVFVYVGF